MTSLALWLNRPAEWRAEESAFQRGSHGHSWPEQFSLQLHVAGLVLSSIFSSLVVCSGLLTPSLLNSEGPISGHRPCCSWVTSPSPMLLLGESSNPPFPQIFTLPPHHLGDRMQDPQWY